MKGTIVIHQDKALSLNSDLDIIDTAILAYIYWGINTATIKESKGYYKIEPDEIEQQLPIIKIASRSINQRLNIMVDYGIFDKKRLAIGNIYKPLDPFKTLFP